ncbi:hypothetical protein [Jeotgalibacillus soli]|uniref:Uncharacterized protein n=1 Tax=Jeotgalibacillus soli TaxID=889306 RepID=A0A0C2V9Y2_9BACL|nr:hypothetical protein [Jeotgalibacillus soli]KIL45772.1 hypothetical protein KP78_21210 [Jeotgalibacillus soli]
MQIAHEVATSQVVWAILCISLAFLVIREMRKENLEREKQLQDLYKESRVESKEREMRLMEHLERSNESQEQTAEALKGIQNTLGTIEGRVDRMEKKIYRRSEQ